MVQIWRSLQEAIDLIKLINFDNLNYMYISSVPGDYSEGVIPDPIPNSEVKPLSADGTLS